MVELIPSILVESEKEFERRLRLVDPHVKTVHVDILDGTLFPHMSWHDARVIGDIDTLVRYEIHLMVENPLPIIEDWKKHVPQLARAIIHAELDRPVGLILEEIKQQFNLETGVALNPETPIKEALTGTPHLDSILMMGIHPGASGQTFLGESILEKIRAVHQHAPQMPVSCDGGVNLENAEVLVAAGCTRLVTASAIFNAGDPAAALIDFQKRLSAHE